MAAAAAATSQRTLLKAAVPPPSSSTAASTAGGASIAEATERFLLAPNNYQALWTYAEKQMNLGQQLLDQGNVDTAYHKLKAAHVCYAYIIAFSVAASKTENDKLESQSRRVYALKKTAKDLLARKGVLASHTANVNDTVSAASSGSTHNQQQHSTTSHRRQHASSNFSSLASRNDGDIFCTPELFSNHNSNNYDSTGGWSANNPAAVGITAGVKRGANNSNSTRRSSAATPILFDNNTARLNGGGGDNNGAIGAMILPKPVGNYPTDDAVRKPAVSAEGNALYDIMFNSETTSGDDDERFGSLAPSSVQQKVAIGLSSSIPHSRQVPSAVTAAAARRHSFNWKGDAATLSSSSSSSSSSTRTLTQQNAKTFGATRKRANATTKSSGGQPDGNQNHQQRNLLFTKLGTVAGGHHRPSPNDISDDDDNGEENDDRDCLYEDDELDDDSDGEDDGFGENSRGAAAPLRSLFTRSESLIDAFSERVRTSSSRLKDDLLGRVRKISWTGLVARGGANTTTPSG